MLERASNVKPFFQVSTGKMRYAFPYHRPPFLPKPGRLLKRKPVTIAAGFCFNNNDGILLCADTEQTVGEFKLTDSKILTADLCGKAHVAFAIAGDVAHATMCVQEIIEELGNQPSLTTASIIGTIKKRIRYTYKELIYPHPGWQSGQGPAFDLIIGIWTQEGGVKLVASTYASVTKVSGYACRGIGLNLAMYLAYPLYTPTMNRERVELLAANILTHVKESISGCGGQSEFMILETAGGMSRPTKNTEMSEVGDIVQLFDILMADLLFSAGDFGKTDEEVRKDFHKAEDVIINQRKEIREARDRLLRLKNRQR